MTGANHLDYDTALLDVSLDRVLVGDLDVSLDRVSVGDSALGTQLPDADFTLDELDNLEVCNEILNDTRPDVIETIHRAYDEAGADAVETNIFGIRHARQSQGCLPLPKERT